MNQFIISNFRISGKFFVFFLAILSILNTGNYIQAEKPKISAPSPAKKSQEPPAQARPATSNTGIVNSPNPVVGIDSDRKSDFFNKIKELSSLRIRLGSRLLSITPRQAVSGGSIQLQWEADLRSLQQEIAKLGSSIYESKLSPTDIESSNFPHTASDVLRVGTFCLMDRMTVIYKNSGIANFDYGDWVVLANPLDESISNVCIIESSDSIDNPTESLMKNAVIYPIGNLPPLEVECWTSSYSGNKPISKKLYCFFQDKNNKSWWIPMRLIRGFQLPICDESSIRPIDEQVSKKITASIPIYIRKLFLDIVFRIKKHREYLDQAGRLTDRAKTARENELFTGKGALVRDARESIALGQQEHQKALETQNLLKKWAIRNPKLVQQVIDDLKSDASIDKSSHGYFDLDLDIR